MVRATDTFNVVFRPAPMRSVIRTYMSIFMCVSKTGIGYDDEKTLLQKFDHVIKIHQGLKPEYQTVISEITQRMANGTGAVSPHTRTR
jgi:hypothetical protein